ncbi:hypothetical protein EZV62_012478 [Acer yangbiense]|uniref:Multidrug resistance protein n=1 Tax=Acer yangbiense TaxID=1000413 RepID=A0A5C7HWD7_9ROSI|nr:hypothetical protein EZV62_012478 [Acer yangbiense]
MGESSSENKDDGSSGKHEEENEEMIRTKPGSLRMVLKDSDWKDVLLMVMGSIGSVADGSAMALIMLCLGSLMNGYGSSTLTLHDINKYAMSLMYVAVGVGSGAFLEGFCWARTAERQTLRLRRRYLGAVLRQDVGFFDTNHGVSMTSQVVSSISTDTLTIQGVLTEKIANFLMHMSTFITGQLVALYLSWRLAIVAIPALSMLIIPGLVYGKLLGGVGEEIQEAYAIAGGIVEQTVSSMRTVYSYVAEDRMLKSYKISLEPTLKLGIKQGLLKGMAMGSIGITFAVWALQGWYGSTLVKKNAKGGNVFTAGVCIVYAGLSLGGALINVKYLIEANVAASRIFEMIHRVPNIDSADQQGITVLDVKGELEFKDIDFAYPSRPENLVLRKFSLRVMANQTVGLVGKSGSGKSTIINLLERFYDPLEGKILLDGIDIKTLQLRWLRSQMGLVSQEPILFATSIKENILFGKDEASMEEIVVAAKAANAHNFINQLPDGYDTLVGQLGNQMSEGQKQRISIARALLRDPKILLLDEATSAQDSHSEKAVQDALNQASIGRTTIIISHRLSALRNVDLIAVIQSGEVIESGFHDELMGRRGSYSGMVQLQRAIISDNNASTTKSLESNSSDFLDKGTPRTEDKTIESDMQISSHDKITNQLQEDPKGSPSLWYLMCMTVSEWKSTVLGCIGGVCYGMIQPLYSFCLGGLLSVYVITDHREITSQTRIYCFAFLSFAVFAFITNVFQHYHFGIMGESLTKRVRETLFGKIITFEIEWFDQENNSSGSLCSRLATDATMVRTLLTDSLSMLAQNISSATLAVVLSALLSWKLALVAIAMQPFIIGAFYTKAIMMKSMSRKLLKAQNNSTELASEAVANHRIITAFYSQEKILKLHELTQISSTKESRKQSWYAGLGLSISQFLTAANAALIFWYGGKLLYQKQITYKHLFQTFFILVSTGRIIAETGSMTSDLSKGTSALKSIFVILKRESKIDIDDSDGIKPEKINGEIEFKEVDFFYPTRPKQIILMHLSLKIDAGTVVALVGRSGSGKSTIIRLIERFYDPSNGSVEVDGVDIKLYNLRALRSHIALVSQEPTLFMGTIHDNIAYGKENATEAEIVEAATIANAHDFISSLSDGYATYCGERGVQLSGGQKQRVALARAILKNPAILLLDEATSALDINSEKLVQDALEKTVVGRTCVVVAHRLSTVQKSDKITVVENGRIIEQGSHSELLAKQENGAYFSLVKFQQLATIEQDVIDHDQTRPSG